MAVRIGHASTDSKPANDQVLIGNYYNGSWTVVLRPRTKAIADKSAAICEAACNNNYIRYSQGSRHTFKKQALIAAGNLSDTDENIAKVTAANVSAIKTICYADCSSFMTFCAIAGGAKISYGSNATVTSTMATRFTEHGDYKKLEAAIYLTSSDYLQRGDILVNNGHTVMVLDPGAKAPSEGIYEDSHLDVTLIKVVATLKSITSTSGSASVKITKISGGKESALKDSNELGLYKWSYLVESLDDSKEKDISETLKIKTSSSSFSFSGLKPDHSYVLRVIASEKKGDAVISSSNIIFTTPQSLPKAITKLDVTFKSAKPILKDFTLSFNAPSSWGNSSLQKCYRLILFVNGKSVAESESVLNPSTSYSTKTKVSLSKITNKTKLFSYNDIVQVGVLPGLKDTKNNFIFDSAALRCSEPFYLRSSLKMIDKVYININNKIMRAIIYNK